LCSRGCKRPSARFGPKNSSTPRYASPEPEF
jgi:hypothetical protein